MALHLMQAAHHKAHIVQDNRSACEAPTILNYRRLGRHFRRPPTIVGWRICVFPTAVSLEHEAPQPKHSALMPQFRYWTDAAQNQEDMNNIRQAMKSAKIPGNFRNLFMYSPNCKKDGIQIIPLSEVAAKNEFLNIKNVSRYDMMAAYRALPQILGIIPIHTGGFGGVEKANELMPL